MIHPDLLAGVHCTLVDSSNPNFVDISPFFFSEFRQGVLLNS